MPVPSTSQPTSDLLDALRSDHPFVAAELRPPRAELAARAGMDAWIDTYHAVRNLTRDGRFVFLTDNAVGAREEDNLRHLVINLGTDAPRHRVVPFLTSKHPLDYCTGYPERARQHGFQALVVLGGDRHDGVPRCLEHANQLRQAIRREGSILTLGGWANPHRDVELQASLLAAEDFTAEFYLTQIVSHLQIGAVERFLASLARRRVDLPGIFGIFYYRSANRKTLARLGEFIPVPEEGLAAEFASGATPDEVAARTIGALASLGIRRFYVSNLPLERAAETLDAVLAKAGGCGL